MGRKRLYHTKEQQLEAKRKSNERWRKSEQGRAWFREYAKQYAQTERAKLYNKTYQKRYRRDLKKINPDLYEKILEYQRAYSKQYAKTDECKKSRRKYLDKIKAQNLERGLRSDGKPFVNNNNLMRAKTGITLRQWEKQYRNGEIEWDDLPSHAKSRLKPRDPNHAIVKKNTGKTLQQWADQYGISRERVRQLHKKWGTLTDDLIKNRSTSRSVEKRQKKAPETAVN